MNPFVESPDWGWWIILYFFLGGLAAGGYFLATLIELFGHEEDRPLARIGYRVAFPLVLVCGVFLIVDLEKQAVSTADGSLVMHFEIDPFRKYCLVNGLDEIGLTLRHADRIREFETRRKTQYPWYF